MNIRSAVILCGGRGSRLGELGKKLPKTLVNIQSKPILWYILNSLKKNSFNHFILPIGYKGTQIKNYLRYNKKFKKFNIEIIETGIDSTIAERIFKIKNFIKSKNFMILNGDSIFQANLNEIFKKHEIKKKDLSFICCEAEADFGTVGVSNQRVVNFERNLSFYSVNTNTKNFKAYVYSGMSIINKKILMENFKKFSNFEKNFYPKIIKKFRVDYYTLKGFWYAMDNIKDFGTLNNRLINKKVFNNIKQLKKKLND